MSGSLIAAALWVLAATGTALLPICMQYRMGFALLLAAPSLLIWIHDQHGPWVTGLAVLAILSLFRKPLGFLIRKALRKT